MGTNTGRELWSRNGVLIHATTDSMIWAPFGWLVIPMLFGKADGTKQDEDVNKVRADFGFLSVVNSFSVDGASRLADGVWSAVVGMSKEYLQQNSTLLALLGPRVASLSRALPTLSRPS